MTDITGRLVHEAASPPAREPVAVVAADLNFDYIHECPALQAGREVIISSVCRQLAGAGGIAACGFARLGAEVRLLAAVGDDADGRDLVAEIARRGIRTDGISLHPGERSAVTLIFSDEARGTPRQAATLPGVHLRFTLPPGTLAPCLVGADVLYSCSYFLLPRLAADLPRLFPLARRRGVATAYDANNGDGWDDAERLRTLREGILPLCDVILVNADEAFSLTGNRDPRAAVMRIGERGATVAVKRGAAGVVVREGERLLEAPAFPPPAPVRDTVGAGDTFAATFLCCRAAGLPLESCALLASANAASTVTCPGGTSGQLDRQGLARFLKRYRVWDAGGGRFRVEQRMA